MSRIATICRKYGFVVMLKIDWIFIRVFTQNRSTKEGESVAKSVRLDESFVADIEISALAEKRSVPKQIEHLAGIGRIVEENPDLPYAFIKDALLALQQRQLGRFTAYERNTNKQD